MTELGAYPIHALFGQRFCCLKFWACLWRPKPDLNFRPQLKKNFNLLQSPSEVVHCIAACLKHTKSNLFGFRRCVGTPGDIVFWNLFFFIFKVFDFWPCSLCPLWRFYQNFAHSTLGLTSIRWNCSSEHWEARPALLQ